MTPEAWPSEWTSYATGGSRNDRADPAVLLRERRVLDLPARLSCRWRQFGPRLIRVSVRKGRLLSPTDPQGNPIEAPEARLEPQLLAESLAGNRARRVLIDLADLPDHVYQAVLAAEDSRFFKHRGLDGKAIARALLRNLKAGEVKEGASTITQQLIKNRDLTPKRTLGRKASKAVRALTLEAQHEKEEILAAYLNSVYLGHVGQTAVHGLGTAAQVYFARDAEDLSLAEAAALAAMIQGPNRLSPIDDPSP